jgi:hypothetical protein
LDFSDLNDDGWEDLYVAAGPLNFSDPQPNELFLNSGHRDFLDMSAPSHTDDPGISRGVAFADYDRDGRVDLFVLNQKGHPTLFRNVSPRGDRHWLEVHLVGRVSNRDACGATVVARVADGPMMRQRSCGGTTLASGNDPYIHFGLGASALVRRLVVHWPSGRVSRLTRVAGDRPIKIREPKS